MGDGSPEITFLPDSISRKSEHDNSVLNCYRALDLRRRPAAWWDALPRPPALTLSGAFTRWTLDPWALALVVVLGGGYLYAMRRARRVTEWGVARPIWILGLGVGPLVLATMPYRQAPPRPASVSIAQLSPL